jgi:hypothetical protein
MHRYPPHTPHRRLDRLGIKHIRTVSAAQQPRSSPNQSAIRTSVPRLPGSWIPSSTSVIPLLKSGGGNTGFSKTANTWFGVASQRGQACSRSAPLASCTGTLHMPSLAIHSSTHIPAGIASPARATAPPTIFGPSATNTPASSRNFLWLKL